jgi:hypothetical protein
VSRPSPAAGLLDAVRAAVPERIRKRLDAGNPAEGWAWAAGADATTVTTDGGEVVTVTHREGGVQASDLRCSCLLSPRCLHVLAVTTSLAASGPVEAAPAPAPPVERPAPPPSPPAALDAGQRSAVQATLGATRAVLAAGATGAGATAIDDLRRAVHACRATSLPRLARAGQRVLGGLSDLRAGKPQFSLPTLTADVRELLWTAELLGRGLGRASDVGTSRRAYEPVGTLRLYGLACEPVAAAAGFGGVSTLLVDATGRLSTIADVRPGGAGRAKASYEAPAQLGGATLPHRELARHGLFVQNATRSADGRLGMGEGVRAVRAGRGSFDDPPVAARFAEPVARQLANPEPLGWLFLVVTVHGVEGGALVATVDGLRAPVRLVAPTDHRELAYVENLRTLARAPGLRLRLIARPAGRRRTLAVLAAAAAPGEDRLRLPPEWAGRVSLGYDLLVAAHVAGLGAREVEVAVPDEEDLDPLAPMRRRVERVVLGGRGTLPGAAGGLVEREAAALRRLHLGAGADALDALFRSGRAPEPAAFAVEWARAATWLDVVHDRLAVADWGA